MNQRLHENALKIVSDAISAVSPKEATQRIVKKMDLPKGRLVLVSIGKAAFLMAKSAAEILGEKITSGIVITKYGHANGKIKNVEIFEAGHPVPDENSFLATKRALELTQDLTENDRVLFLVSGGGSALFECPKVAPKKLFEITNELLKSGADITQINTIRKRLSLVKGGKFAAHIAPCPVTQIVLSDILGDPLSQIASGPCAKDDTTATQALKIAKEFNLSLDESTLELLSNDDTPDVKNVETFITGSVRELARAAKKSAEGLGYEAVILTDCAQNEARELGKFLASVAKTHQDSKKPLAFICGGETVVHLTGHGMGGRNQEIALSAANDLCGLKNCAVFSVGSDGTDGPTDAAGGYADSDTKNELSHFKISIDSVLKENDAYHALKKVDSLIITGPTGTNVNDISVLLID